MRRNLGWVVGVAITLRAGRSGYLNPAEAEAETFSPPNHSDRLWGQPGPLFYGWRGSFPWVKRTGRDVDHSPSSSAEVKNEWSYNYSPPIRPRNVDWNKFFTCTLIFILTPSWGAWDIWTFKVLNFILFRVVGHVRKIAKKRLLTASYLKVT